ncbi:MAG: insulinase family protein [Candidatus Cloacimonetes bacterium]|nr:insulinase family protein [Candidatus Cloacimonadota bacterium]
MKAIRLTLTLLLIMISVTACVTVRQPKSELLPSHPDIISGRLANGLNYYILKNNKPEKRAELRLFVNAGSVNEDDDQKGLAHFTEHMAFNGTASFERTEVVDYLTSIGMGFTNGLNAATSFEFTFYMLKVPTDDLQQLRSGFHILSEMAHTVAFAPDELESERGVILEEWRMGQGAQQRISDASSKVLFAGSKYAERTPIGTEEVLRNFTREEIVRFYNDWYYPGNQSVVAIGDFDVDAIEEIIKEYFGIIPAKENPRPAEVVKVPDNIEPQVLIITDPEMPNTTAQFIWKRPVRPTVTVDDYLDNLKQELYLNMLSSRLEELTKQPDPPYTFALMMSGNVLKGLGGTIGAAVMSSGKGLQAVQAVLGEVERVDRHGFLESELQRAKQKQIRSLERSVAQKATRSSDSYTMEIIQMLSHGDILMSPEDEEAIAKKLLEEITLADINAVGAQLFTDHNRFIALVGPESDKDNMPNEEELLAVFDTVKELALEPYSDTVSDQPFISEKLRPATIKKVEENERAGIVSWTLANGVKVHLKHTNFKEDEVVLSAWSPGGYSYCDEASLPSARLLPAYIADSGFGEFDSIALSKATAGKVANARITLGLNSEGFGASCSPQDLELMFQLIHQYGTNPRFDETNFQSFLQRQASMLEHNRKDPQNYFMELMFATPYQNHPYKRLLELEDIQKADIEVMKEIFAERFADFSDFQFVIVGNFDESKIKNYVRTYLGNLPATYREEPYRDVGVRTLEEASINQFELGIGERCFASLISINSFDFDIASQSRVNVLEQIYFERLRENVRENLSGAYVVQPIMVPEKYPEPHLITYSFLMCDPARVDELLDATLATVDSLRMGLFDDKYVQNAKITLLKKHEEQIQSNYFWQNSIIKSIQNGEAMDYVLDYPQYFQAITKEDVITAALRHLHFDDNIYRLIMLPQKEE